ncbi:MAG: MarR family transcriptional regulator [Spirochaetia bacterium]|nr:MarR family transcriptional regulator [Spirochaetia bacterium]
MTQQKGSKPKSLRKENTTGILELFKKADILAASDIQEHINLSKPTIMKILDTLEQENFILKEGKGESSDEGGRRPTLYKLNSQRSFSIAFHIFPNEIYGVIADLKSRILKTISRDIDSSISF